MGAVFWFLVFGFLVHFILSSSGSILDEAKQISSNIILPPVLKSIYDKWDIEKKPPRCLDKKDLHLLLVCLTEKYEYLEKDKIKLTQDNCQLIKQKCELIKENNILLSLLNIAEYVENLFLSCWPKWAGIRNNKDHSEHSWKIMFLNFEHPRIRLLKRNMIALNLTEETFIRSMSDLELLRSREADAAMKLDKWNEPYHLFPKFAGKTKPLLQAIIRDIFNEPLELKSPQDAVEKIIESTINEQRKSFRLLKIPQLVVYEDKRDLEWGLGDLVKQMNPVAFIANEYTDENTGYILFSNFKDAYTVWEQRVSRGRLFFREPTKDSMTIIPATTGPVSNSDGFIKIEATESNIPYIRDQIAKYPDLIPLETEKTTKASPKIVVKGSNEESILVTSLFLRYRSIEIVMEAYETYKNCFKSLQPEVTISMIPARNLKI